MPWRAPWLRRWTRAGLPSAVPTIFGNAPPGRLSGGAVAGVQYVYAEEVGAALAPDVLPRKLFSAGWVEESKDAARAPGCACAGRLGSTQASGCATAPASPQLAGLVWLTLSGYVASLEVFVGEQRVCIGARSRGGMDRNSSIHPGWLLRNA